MKPNILFYFVVCMLLFTLSCTKNDEPADPPDQTIPVVGTASFTVNAYTLVFTNNDPGLDTAIRSNLVRTFFTVYPEEVKKFNLQSIDTVHFIMDTSYSGIAATGGGTVTFNASYFHSHPKDIDIVTHEVMHIVQSYPQYKPVWLVEGIADYVRYLFGVDNAGAGWSLPDFSPNQHYTDSYRVTARFLLWLEKNKYHTLVEKLDVSLRDQSYYNQDTWKKITGKSLDELWNEYAANPAL